MAPRAILHEARAGSAARLDRDLFDQHGSGNVIDFHGPGSALLWVVNLGCIDLNQWYARCDDVDRPDYLHFDLDPGVGAAFDRVLETSRVVRDALRALKMPSLVKTTGSKGLHVYVPIVRGPVQKQVWTFAKALAQELAGRHPALITAEYRVAKRPHGRVLVDYNQNASERTLASIYSVRPRADAPVDARDLKEIDRGMRIEDFTVKNLPARIARPATCGSLCTRAAGSTSTGTCRRSPEIMRLRTDVQYDNMII
jgi:bifunctional non-homologous end joining protein LigD